MIYECHKDGCHTTLVSRYSYSLHLAQLHNSYEDGRDITEKTYHQLSQVGSRVIYLLLNYPATRNPKNWPLWTQYLQRFSKSHILVYDEAQQGWVVNRQNGVLKAEGLKELFAELETARRRERDYL